MRPKTGDEPDRTILDNGGVWGILLVAVQVLGVGGAVPAFSETVEEV